MVIAARFVWIYPAAYLPRWLSPRLRRSDPPPPWQWPFALAFIGIRGIVSLAAALAIPFTIASGAPFPHRDLILLMTFSVILATLVGQGLMLPSVIRGLGLAHAGRRERVELAREEARARRRAIEAAIARLSEMAREHQLPPEIADSFHAHYRDRLKHLQHQSDDTGAHRQLANRHDEIELTLITAERSSINDLYRAGQLRDEVRRRVERELDLREAQLANSRSEE